MTLRIDQDTLTVDMGPEANRLGAVALIPKILDYLKLKHAPTSLQEMYQEFRCGDIPLYLALHALVDLGSIRGASPYIKLPIGDDSLFYSVVAAQEN